MLHVNGIEDVTTTVKNPQANAPGDIFKFQGMVTLNS